MGPLFWHTVLNDHRCNLCEAVFFNQSFQKYDSIDDPQETFNENSKPTLKTTNNDPITYTTCMGCQQSVKSTSLVFHLTVKINCMKHYSKMELECLKQNRRILYSFMKVRDSTRRRFKRMRQMERPKSECDICKESFYDLNTHLFIVHKEISRRSMPFQNLKQYI